MQDWTPIVFGDRRSAVRTPPHKAANPANPMLQLDSETEELRHERVSHAVADAVRRARAERGLSQRDLACALSRPTQAIQELEAGRGAPDNALVARIEKHLGIKLPRTRKATKP